MGAAEHWFYHLASGGLPKALPPLLEKVLARDWRALVVAQDAGVLAELDRHLWTFRPDSFLPHGLASEPRAADQPILLSTTGENENSAQVVLLLHGAPLPALDGVERCLTLFDGDDRQALGVARQRWKELQGSGGRFSYWRQDEKGRWSKQESSA